MDPLAHDDDHRDQDHDDPGARGEFGDGRDDGHRAGEHCAERIDGQCPSPALFAVAPPVRHHRALSERERDEHADREQRDQRLGLSFEPSVKDRGGDGEHDDSRCERQAVAHV